MKSFNYILVVVFFSLILTGCKSSENKKEGPADLISIRTLGLAYLEEFKLEEAEEQFLKFIDIAPREKLGYANLGLVYLRMAKYPEAEKQLLKAIRIDPKDPDIRLILATVYKMEDKIPEAIDQLKSALESSPDHIKVLYDLTEIYSTQTGKEAEKLREEYMLILAGKAPGNLVPHLNLTDIFIRKGEFDAAIEQLEIIKKQFPDFPKEAVEYYNNALSFLKKQDGENSIIQFTIFHNYLKVTSPYQAGIMDLKGPGGSLIGFPLITFDQQSSLNTMENESAPAFIKFVDVTKTAGLDILPDGINDNADAIVAASDFDSDGDVDLYIGSFDSSSSTYKHFLMSNDMGRFTDITDQAGIKHTGREFSASFADYDNDGFLDLYIIKEKGNILYRNAGKGTFENITKKTNINDNARGNKALFFDADHDGDLDLYELKSQNNLFYRNNGDGSFTEQAEKMGVAGNSNVSTDAAFGDFDEDGDIDFLVTGEAGRNALYSNQRGGIFRDIAESSGLKSTSGSGTVAVGDYNNDGFLDMFIGSVINDDHRLYRNLHNGKFEMDKNAESMLKNIKGIRVNDAAFFDFDNDGFTDLLIAGESTEEEKNGVFLFHNDGKSGFIKTDDILPAQLNSGKQFALFDYNDDGDQDLILAGVHGGVSLFRNDGGNNNHFIKMKLVGLKAGSAKNNYFGIGAKVEIRAGDLYQTLVVNDPNVHFGLGSKNQADVIRITWTNGVPQNIFMPNSDQSLIESQTLKGSCPFLYTWNGNEYTFTKDILWRSALGMPLGIMGGTTAYAFAHASDDYIKIPGENLQPKNGQYSIQITSELWETIYFDELELVAVDHPESVNVFVPEQFSPPPFPGLLIHKMKGEHLPVSATDSKGNNILNIISKKDEVYVSDFIQEKYQGVTEMKYIILDPGRMESDNLWLIMNGWIFPTDASINVALSQSNAIKVIPPVIEVKNKSGEWVTIIDNLGFPMGKDKMVIADLSDRFLSDDHRIRIRTNMEIYWDHIFFSLKEDETPVIITSLRPVSADLHFRGFSESFRKGGRYGPHWFDYSKVTKEAKWRDLTGNYTRYGDVLPLLKKSDNKYIISNAGDETTITFNMKNLPPLKKGWKRDFLIHSVGWVKDGDLNTAHGNTVLPLPFHGMKSYPPSDTDRYPVDPDLEKYNNEYNTRIVTTDAYLNALKPNNK